ncbi:MAG: BMP family ABC transporter substrate-binding protein [Clostridia bacterium]|nr:BMP family ABC transporter substrate-binding protein [Clostridia bacterium]
MKKILAILLAALLLLCFAACGEQGGTETPSSDAPSSQEDASSNEPASEEPGTGLSSVKIGVILLHDPAASTYDNNFYQAVMNVKTALGLSDSQVIVKYNVPEEGSDCYDTAAEMIDEGCNIIFADSFGHESNMKLAANDFPNVQFCHATGTQAVVTDLPNFHNAFASIYEGRYLAGIAAGMKLNQMIEDGTITAENAKIGYVGAWPYAEVKSGYTSFFLGARSVCPSATMEVVFTNSWFDIALEKEAAENLINNKNCVLISQHADSEGAPKACEAAGVPNVAYNVSTIDLGPTTALISSKINWEPYFNLIINAVANGTEIPDDYIGTIQTGSVELTQLNEAVAAPGTADAIEAAKAKLLSGELHVFDTATFTVDGAPLTSYLADCQDMGDYVGETEVIIDGYFAESQFRSAPYFDIKIDGIIVN